MAYIDRMDGQDYIDKTRAYLDYIEEHLEFVRQAFILITDACKDMPGVGYGPAWRSFVAEVQAHDLSKFSVHEVHPVSSEFFPGE